MLSSPRYKKKQTKTFTDLQIANNHDIIKGIKKKFSFPGDFIEGAGKDVFTKTCL